MAEVMRGCGLAEVSCAMAELEAPRVSAVQKTASSESGWRERCIEIRFMKALTLGCETMMLGLTELLWRRKRRALGSRETIDSLIIPLLKTAPAKYKVTARNGLRGHSIAWRGAGRDLGGWMRGMRHETTVGAPR